MAESRGDIWIQDSLKDAPRNITNGARDSSGWWAPLWSADGAWLAMLSSRGGQVALWGWQRATGELRRISSAAVDFYYKSSNSGYTQACEWMDGHRLLCIVKPGEEASGPLGTGAYYTGRYIAQAEAAWARAKRGEVTASEVSSTRFPVPARSLALIDFNDGQSRLVAETQADPWFKRRGETFWPSPRAGVVALVKAESASEFPDAIRRAMGFPADIELRNLHGEAVKLEAPLPRNVVTRSIQWSPDGRELAFFALEGHYIHPELLYGEAAPSVRYPAVKSKNYPGKLFRVSLATGQVAVVATADADLGQNALPPKLLWLPSGELTLLVTRLGDRAVLEKKSRAQWTVLQKDGGTRPLLANAPESAVLVTSESSRSNPDLALVDGCSAMLALGRGDLWRIDPVSGAAKNLTSTLETDVAAVTRTDEEGRSPYVVIVSGKPQTSEHVLDVRSGEVVQLARPDGRGRLVSAGSTGRSFVFATNDRNGSRLWRSEGRGEANLIATANQFWKTLARPEERVIEYQGFNGERLKAKLTLPPGYRPGRRYPVVVDSELNYTPDTHARNYELSDPDAAPVDEVEIDRNAFTSGGYIYLWASMPTRYGLDEVGLNNLLMLAHGLVPAVDAAVAQGYADPDRVFLYGFSSMALGVYGVVTQTSRFTAAVGAFGWVDNSSKTLALDMRRRYSETPFTEGDFQAQYLDGGFRSWRDGDLLRRNSPLTYVDRIQTPLMIVDSDFDAGFLENSEMLFSALIQQRKPAKFVRYWGEGHGTQSPANTLDFYQRVFAWFDEWGDIARDARGNLIFEGNRVSSRRGAPPLRSEDFAAFDVFGPANTPQQRSTRRFRRRRLFSRPPRPSSSGARSQG